MSHTFQSEETKAENMTTEQDTSMQQNTSTISSGMSPQEEALQSLCKQLLKSTFFRGYYEERRHVDVISGYRDVVGLHRCERDFERLLIDIKRKLQLFYQHTPLVWIGITHGPFMGVERKKYTLATHIWLQLEDVAFGQYWFNVKSVRFRRNEVILKVKVVRAVETESMPMIQRIASTTTHTTTPTASMCNNSNERRSSSTLGTAANDSTKTLKYTSQLYGERANAALMDEPQPEMMQIGYEDFVNVVRDWGVNIKHSVYDFMSNDINKDNIRDLLQFLGLLVIGLLTGSVVAIKYLGIFTLRFMFEFTRFTHVITPILIKMLEVINKIMGGLFLLIAMIWKDIFAKRKMPQQYTTSLPEIDDKPARELKAIEYNRPLYKSIQYNIRQGTIQPTPYRPSSIGPFTEFERKFQ